MTDFLADGLKAAVDILVGETEYFQPIFLETSTSLFVILHFLGHIMLRAIQFHYQFCIMAVKVYNIAFDGLLPLKPGEIFTQKLKPKSSLLGRGAFSQGFGLANLLLFIWQ